MNFHRYYFPGQIVFITQVVKDRQKVFNDVEMVDLLREVFHSIEERFPFVMLGYVFLPDHFHILIRPKGNNNFSQIMHSLKGRFTLAYKNRINFSGHMNFWQKRFWDHVIRDEKDFENHINYIHYNPIKHGYARNLSDWQYRSFAVWEQRGVYDREITWDEPVNGEWGE